MIKQCNLYDYTHSFLKFLLSLFFCCSLSVAATCAAAEGGYWITETELTQLESNLTRLSAINQQSQQDLALLEQQLEKSQQELTVARKKSALLEQQLAALKLDSQKQEQLLQTANASLQTFAAEEKRTRLRIKAQRNTWETVSVILVGALIHKN